MKRFVSAIAIAATLSFTSVAVAQRPGGQRGGPQAGGPPQRGMNQANMQNTLDQTQFGNQAVAGQDGSQNMPSIDMLAQMMLANFDSDGSGELGLSELQNALVALRQMMQSRNGAQNQGANGFAGQQRGMQGIQNLQGDQNAGNRPPPRRRPRDAGDQ